jgi:GNAT superfamily N-acetyltransferase
MIREASVNDCARMAEIEVFGWRCGPYKEFISIEYLINKMAVKKRREMFEGHLSEKITADKTYVYEENTIIKAYMVIGNCRDGDKDEKTFALEGIFVDPLFQRQKIGTQLVNYCEAEAKFKGKKEIVVWTFEKNGNSIEFYEKLGFKSDGKIKIIEAFNERAVRFNKPLRPEGRGIS